MNQILVCEVRDNQELNVAINIDNHWSCSDLVLKFYVKTKTMIEKIFHDDIYIQILVWFDSFSKMKIFYLTLKYVFVIRKPNF